MIKPSHPGSAPEKEMIVDGEYRIRLFKTEKVREGRHSVVMDQGGNDMDFPFAVIDTAPNMDIHFVLKEAKDGRCVETFVLENCKMDMNQAWAFAAATLMYHTIKRAYGP